MRTTNTNSDRMPDTYNFLAEGARKVARLADEIGGKLRENPDFYGTEAFDTLRDQLLKAKICISNLP